MQITIEILSNRIRELDQVMQQTLSNYNAMEGAKQECLSWIKKIEEEKVSKQLYKGE